MDEAAFVKRYPISLTGVIFATLDFKNERLDRPEIPFPTVAGMREFAEYCGFSYGSLRTTVSQFKKYGVIESLKDGPRTRYRLSSTPPAVFTNWSDGTESGDRFTIAVFSFARENQKERHLVRQLLKQAGFRRLANSVYIGGRADRAELRAMMEQLGVAGNCYLFESEFDDDDTWFIEKMREMWDVKQFEATVSMFRRDIAQYLQLEQLCPKEVWCRIIYAGSHLFEVILPQKPKLPERLMPDGQVMSDLILHVRGLAERHIEALESYFIDSNT